MWQIDLWQIHMWYIDMDMRSISKDERNKSKCDEEMRDASKCDKDIWVKTYEGANQIESNECTKGRLPYSEYLQSVICLSFPNLVFSMRFSCNINCLSPSCKMPKKSMSHSPPSWHSTVHEADIPSRMKKNWRNIIGCNGQTFDITRLGPPHSHSPSVHAGVFPLLIV